MRGESVQHHERTRHVSIAKGTAQVSFLFCQRVRVPSRASPSMVCARALCPIRCPLCKIVVCSISGRNISCIRNRALCWWSQLQANCAFEKGGRSEKQVMWWGEHLEPTKEKGEGGGEGEGGGRRGGKRGRGGRGEGRRGKGRKGKSVGLRNYLTCEGRDLRPAYHKRSA